MAVQITVYDGANCIGGNKVHLDFDGHGIFFDFGLNYKKLGEFYEEFLSPRPIRGVHDFIFMGLLPKLNIYRQDLIPSDVDLSMEKKIKVDAVFLSHSHMDHVGSASFLDSSIPFISTPVTAALLKAMKDCNTSGFQYESPYFSQRSPHKEDSRVMTTSREDYVGRSFAVTDGCGDPFRQFWGTCPTKKKKMLPGRLNDLNSLGFECRCMEVDHSIYGASAMAIETSSGWVVYSGDLRLHGKQKEKTEKFIEKTKDLQPRALIVEGTRASREDREESEENVLKNCLRAVEEEEGMVVADFGASQLRTPRYFSRDFEENWTATDRPHQGRLLTGCDELRGRRRSHEGYPGLQRSQGDGEEL